MTKKTHYKDLARHQAKIRAEHHHKRRRRRIGGWSIAIFAFIFMLVVFLVATTGGDVPDNEAAGPDCEPGPALDRTEEFPMSIDRDQKYVATMQTTDGPIQIDLLSKDAPITVNNFVNLAEAGYYDCTVFHRVANSIDVIQGGDGQCTFGDATCGQGGPGYTIVDELTGDERYAPGTVAMANAGPNTGGSQFFIVTGPGARSLPKDYTVFGEVSGGMGTAEKIQDTPVSGETPTQQVTIESVTIEPSSEGGQAQAS